MSYHGEQFFNNRYTENLFTFLRHLERDKLVVHLSGQMVRVGVAWLLAGWVVAAAGDLELVGYYSALTGGLGREGGREGGSLGLCEYLKY